MLIFRGKITFKFCRKGTAFFLHTQEKTKKRAPHISGALSYSPKDGLTAPRSYSAAVLQPFGRSPFLCPAGRDCSSRLCPDICRVPFVLCLSTFDFHQSIIQLALRADQSIISLVFLLSSIHHLARSASGSIHHFYSLSTFVFHHSII